MKIKRLVLLFGLGCCFCTSCAEVQQPVQQPEERPLASATPQGATVAPTIGNIPPPPPPAEVITCQVSMGNVRSGPSMQHRIVGAIRLGEPVTLTGRKGDWLHIAKSDGRTGWCHASLFVPQLPMKKAKKPPTVREQVVESDAKKAASDQASTDQRPSVTDVPNPASSLKEAEDSTGQTQAAQTPQKETEAAENQTTENQQAESQERKDESAAQPAAESPMDEDRPGGESGGKEPDTPSARKTMKTWGSGPVKVYRDASLLSDVIGSVPPDTTVFFLNQIDNFYCVEYEGITGYILKNLAE